MMPSMTGVQYEKKVRDYLKGHLDHLVVHRLRTNRALTATDLDELERVLTEIGGDDGGALLSSWLERTEAPSLGHFVRTLVGLDRAAAQSELRFGAEKRGSSRLRQRVDGVLSALDVIAFDAPADRAYATLRAAL